jgi:hypothetical protein
VDWDGLDEVGLGGFGCAPGGLGWAVSVSVDGVPAASVVFCEAEAESVGLIGCSAGKLPLLVPDGFLTAFAVAETGEPVAPVFAAEDGLSEPILELVKLCEFGLCPVGLGAVKACPVKPCGFVSDLGCVAVVFATPFPRTPGTPAADVASTSGLSGTDGKRCARMSEARR